MNSLKRAIDVVDDSGVELLIDTWRAEDGYDPSKGGRPATIQPRTVLALMALLTIEAKPLHIQQAVNIITDRANNQVLRALVCRSVTRPTTPLTRAVRHGTKRSTVHGTRLRMSLTPTRP